MYKSEVWGAQKKQRDNEHLISDWTAALNKANLAISESSMGSAESENGIGGLSELLPSKHYLHLELLPYLALIQAPSRTPASSAQTHRSGGRGLFGKAGKSSDTTEQRQSPLLRAMKLNKGLLDVASMPPAKLDSGPTALGEKEDLDVPEGSDDEMKRKPAAPAVKLESDEEEAGEIEEEMEVDKLYLSDDDIEDF